LEPNETADFPEDEFNSRTPGRRNAIADGFHASLYRSLKPSKQFGFLIESRRNNQPRKHHRENAKRVNFRMMSQA
jgi:hypothetical protein